jgi:hypothetical protein
MERITCRVRQIHMMDQRPLRGPAGLGGCRGLGGRRGMPGLLGTGLLVAALAGCGSVVASSSAPAPTATTTASASSVGCASVNQATAVSIRKMMHLMAPVGTNPVGTSIYHQTAQVQALFGQLCAAVTHPAPTRVMPCPADFGTEYLGTFYDGSRVLATFTYASSGCERVSVTAAGKTKATMVYGRAAAAAPDLAADLDTILGPGQKPGLMQPQATLNPGGPDRPA